MTDKISLDYRDIALHAWGETLRKTVESVIADHAGHGLDTEIQQVIKSEARKMVETDPELRQMILDAMKSWISTQTADDYRKLREDNIRRFGAR